MLSTTRAAKRLQACTPELIYCALLACAQDWLEPAHFGSTRRDPVQGIRDLMIGWRGFVHLAAARRFQLTSELVYRADLFKPIQGSKTPASSTSPASMRVRSECVRACSPPDEPAQWDWMTLAELQRSGTSP